jgi:hypothetical protein
MMGLQDLVVGALAALALGWLVRRQWRKRRRPAAWCGDCPGCEGAPVEAPDALVTIAPPPER